MASRMVRNCQLNRSRGREPIFVLWAGKAVRLLLFGALLLTNMGSYSGTVRTAATAEDAPVLKTSIRAGSEECWVFMHLQKAGGTTVKKILSRRWRRAFSIYDSPQWKSGGDLLGSIGQKLAGPEELNVVAGGYTEALRRSRAVADKCRWFTQFRHPVSRMVSAYYYCKTSTGDNACASVVLNANEANLETFAKHWGNFAMRQFALDLVNPDDVMAYSITDAAREQLPQSVTSVSEVPGWYLLKMYLDNSESAGPGAAAIASEDVALNQMLRPVQDLLRDNYAAVGILEEFNTTLSLFDVALAMPGVDWRKRFASQGNRNSETEYAEEEAASLADAWTNSEIKKYMQLDLVLYEHAVDVFHKQVQAYGI